MTENILIKSKSRKLLKVAALLLVFSLILQVSLAPQIIRVAASTTSQELQEAKARQAALAAEKARLAAQNKQLSQTVTELSGQLAWLNSRTEEQKQLFAEKSIQLEAAISASEAAYSAYLKSEEDLKAKQVQYAERVRTMFEHQQRSILEVFLKSNSLQGFFTTLDFMAIVADTDQQMIEELQAAKDDAALKRDQAKQVAADMEVVVKQIEADMAKLKADAEATQADMNQAQLKLDTQEQAEDALYQESLVIAALVTTLQKKYDAEQYAGGWYWPYPGDKTVYSGYGMRYHPIYHSYRFHSGVDLGGTYGNPVVATRTGTVILVRNPVQGRNTGGSGYGNYIVIDHGDGFATLYAHLKQTLVVKDQQVNIGERIGLCGSTGTSTGPHLHFEIIKNGATVDPTKYIK